MRIIFKDPELDRQFAEQGYFKLQLLNDEELQQARAIFDANDPKLAANFYSSIDSKDFDYRRSVHNQLKPLIEDKLLDFFIDYKPIAYTFIAKKPNSTDSVVYPHADDTHIFEEDHLCSVNIFCPLVDTYEENGALYVLPGSHKLPYPWRGFGMPFPYEQYWDHFKDRMIMAPQKAGEAIFYHDRLIHRSGPNRSSAIRPVIVTGLMPNESTQVICYQHEGTKEDEVEIFEIDQDFWFTFDPNSKPNTVRSLGIREYKPITMSVEEFEIRMGWRKPNFMQKVKAALFGA